MRAMRAKTGWSNYRKLDLKPEINNKAVFIVMVDKSCSVIKASLCTVWNVLQSPVAQLLYQMGPSSTFCEISESTHSSLEHINSGESCLVWSRRVAGKGNKHRQVKPVQYGWTTYELLTAEQNGPYSLLRYGQQICDIQHIIAIH